jgi:hypothetical protein
VDGVCCDTACAGQCESCGIGTCIFGAGQPAPGRPKCAGFNTPCAGSCDGKSAECSYPKDTPCGKTSCQGNDHVEQACDGAGSCAELAPVSCAPYRCAGTKCVSSCGGDDSCLPSARCEQQKCVPRTTPVCQSGESIGLDGAAT